MWWIPFDIKENPLDFSWNYMNLPHLSFQSPKYSIFRLHEWKEEDHQIYQWRGSRCRFRALKELRRGEVIEEWEIMHYKKKLIFRWHKPLLIHFYMRFSNESPTESELGLNIVDIYVKFYNGHFNVGLPRIYRENFI